MKTSIRMNGVMSRVHTYNQTRELTVTFRIFNKQSFSNTRCVVRKRHIILPRPTFVPIPFWASMMWALFTEPTTAYTYAFVGILR